MTSIDSLTLEVDDPSTATPFYDTAFGTDVIRVRKTDAATSGFRGFTISLLVSQPANASALIDAAIGAGATVLKPATKSFWGFGGVVQAPDGTICKVATSAKKDGGPAATTIDSVVLLIAVEDVVASKAFYVERGFTIGRSFGKYVEFATPGSPVGFGLYTRKALAKDAGVPVDGAGSHRLAIGSDAGSFFDPDGFLWES